VEALERAIERGEVDPGTRLPPHRRMASQLDLSVGTVSKAYAEAEQRGLITGEVGRGTFVRKRARGGAKKAAADGPLDLALNVPPSTGEDELLARTLNDIVSGGGFADLLAYQPHQGRREHRDAFASWLSRPEARVEPNRLFVTHGAQHALSVALGMVVRSGDPVLAEDLTYSGMLSLAEQSAYRLHGVAMDGDGLRPDALDRAFSETGARVLFSMPNLQSPTAITMPYERRRAIAEVLERHDAYLVEDDAYAFLFADRPTSISELIPERSFYAVSFAKCLAPGLRIGALIVPDAFRDRCVNAMRATGWMAVPVMAEAVKRLIENGGLDRQVAMKRVEAAQRSDVARDVLGRWMPISSRPPGFHAWLPLPAGRPLTGFIAQAAQAGVKLALPGSLRPLSPMNTGVRLCLGAPADAADLERALHKLRFILEATEAFSVV
jgi:DNA-binding transcriptional MocR family regulator